VTPTGRPPEEYRGWKEIALALRVSVRTAKELAARELEPLPVRKDHRGVYAIRSRLQDWVDSEDVAYKAHLRLVRSERAARNPSATPLRGSRPRSASAVA